MDDQTESERPSIGITREVFCDLAVVIGGLVCRSIITNPVCQVLKSSNDVVSRLCEAEVRKTTALIEIRLVDEVPCALETVGALDVISKSRTFCERMTRFAFSQRGMSLSQTI